MTADFDWFVDDRPTMDEALNSPDPVVRREVLGACFAAGVPVVGGRNADGSYAYVVTPAESFAKDGAVVRNLQPRFGGVVQDLKQPEKF